MIQIWDFWVLVLCCTSKFSQIHEEILGFLNVIGLDFSIFPNSRKRTLYFQIVTNSLKSWEIGIFEVSLILYLSDCEDSQARYVCRRKMGI